jgi:hypothetical protein
MGIDIEESTVRGLTACADPKARQAARTDAHNKHRERRGVNGTNVDSA